MKITAVLAMSENRVIGKNGWLPWHIPEDMKHFQKITKWATVVMWRTTYESLPERYRPLPWRRNIVLSRNTFTECESYTSISKMLDALQKENVESIYIIWWSQIYHAFFEQGLTDIVECTLVSWNYEGDTHIPEWRDDFTLESSETFSEGAFQRYTKKVTR